MNRFRDFLKNHPDSLVPPVILSGRGKWTFRPSDDGSPFGTLVIEEPAAILDGQHRLGGYVIRFLDDPPDVRQVDFLLLEDLTREEEIKEFVIVNNTQVGVPKSLNFHIGADIAGLEVILGGDIADEAWMAWQLNLRDDSPFHGRISRIKSAPAHLFNLSSVTKSLKRMFKHGAFSQCDKDEKLEITIRYWNLIESLHPKEWADVAKLGVKGEGRRHFDSKLLELTGFIAWSLVGNSSILSSSYNAQSHTVDWDRVQALIEILCTRVDWRKDGEFEHSTGEVGGPKIMKEMENILARNPL